MSPRRVAIRVDASDQIGTGHVMRCLTLADALQAAGAQVRFVCLHLPEHLQEVLLSRGHALARLDCLPGDSIPGDLSHAHWLGIDQRTDAHASLQALSDHAWDWRVVDHYVLDSRWESANWICALAATECVASIIAAIKILSDGGADMSHPEFLMARSQDLPVELHDAEQFYWSLRAARVQAARIFYRHSTAVVIPRRRVPVMNIPDDRKRAELLAPMVTAQEDYA